jgi:ethanolamine utilization protein EutN
MIICKVIGSIVSTIKHDSFKNQKIMLVRPINLDGSLKSGTMVAIDTVCAGVGDIVLVASEGRSAMELLGFNKREPLRSVIIGVVDTIDVTKQDNQ